MNSTSHIFRETIVKKCLEHFTYNDINNYEQKYKEILRWHKSITQGDLNHTKEETIQGSFMTRVFNQVLGYKEVVDDTDCYHQEREYKTILDTTESDGALGFFDKKTGDKTVRVVVELKDAHTSLDKKQHRSSHLTPVEQAFSYANKNGSNCRWVIVSNFVEIRLYKSNSSLEYETFDFSKMDDSKEFIRLYYFLCKDNLITRDGKSTIDLLYDENEASDIEITNQFYGTYKNIRDQLFIALKENNKNIDELTLFTKTQKLMDRLIFICFCEDCELLPPNTYINLIDNAKHSFSSSSNKIWDQLKGLFQSIDKGNPPMNINRYNGGLFKSDSILDSLFIPDETLESFAELSKYDFNSDLNVNILGQIFEQSIDDVEFIKAKISGKEVDSNKQKDDGIYYTPYYVTRYMVENTVGSYLKNKREELKRDIFKNGAITVKAKRRSTNKENSKSFTTWIEIPERKESMTEDEEMEILFAEQLHLYYWNEYENILKSIKICDPACGSGAFLNQCYDYLHEEMDFVLDMKYQFDAQRSWFDIDKEILQNKVTQPPFQMGV